MLEHQAFDRSHRWPGENSRWQYAQRITLHSTTIRPSMEWGPAAGRRVMQVGQVTPVLRISDVPLV